ncbi:31496_t:CDS:2, partial [Racocetra persica]
YSGRSSDPISEVAGLMANSMHAKLEEAHYRTVSRLGVELSGSESEEKDKTEKVDNDSDDWEKLILKTFLLMNGLMHVVKRD